MKIQQIFCDICDREGAHSQSKDSKHVVAQIDTDKSKMLLKGDDGRSLPYVSVSYAKRVHGGGIEELDLCSICKSEVEGATADKLLDLFAKGKEKKKPKR